MTYQANQSEEVSLKTALRENHALRSLLCEVLKSLGNGSGASPECSLDFLGDIPEEVRLVVADLRAALPPQAKAEPAGVSEREAFEAWAGDQGFSLRRLDISDGESYQDLRTQGPWDAWQARAILSTAPSTGVREAQVQSSEPSACSHCDDLGWEWEHGLGNESWKVACHLHCAATAKWLADEHGVAVPDEPIGYASRAAIRNMQLGVQATATIVPKAEAVDDGDDVPVYLASGVNGPDGAQR